MQPELPRERCLHHGPASLSLRECVALVLGTAPRPRASPPLPSRPASEPDSTPGSLQLARRILARLGSEGLGAAEAEAAFFNRLESASETPLREIAGLGDAGRARLLAAMEIGRRYALHRERVRTARARPAPRTGRSLPDSAAARIPWEWRSATREWLAFVPVRPDGALGSFCWVEKGVRTHVNTDPAALFSAILAVRPAAFFLFHNHPSGDVRPSEPDLELTRRVQSLGRQLGIPCLGHALVTAREEAWIVV